MNTKVLSFLFVRIALAASFLSAVADRFGVWGNAGSPGVVWGNFQSFTDYTATLMSYLPMSLITGLAWVATIAEVVLALLLLIGFKLRIVSLLSAVLLASFALTMAFSYGLKAPLDYSVFTACAAALLLARTSEA